jgi:hypothetical protein
MIELINTYIDTFSVDQLNIHWEVQNTGEVISDYHLDLYRAETSADISEFEYIASGIDPSLGLYEDNNLQKMGYSLNRKIYYYIKVIHNTTGVNKNFGPYTMQTVPDYAALEIIRRKNVLLNNKRYSARTFKILKRRTWGDYCSRCFDPITQRVQDANCQTCYGTGIEGGYFQPMEIRGFRSQKSFRQLLNLFGKFEDNEVSFVLQGYPILTINDVLVDELNDRYKILDPVRHTEKGLYILEQQIRAEIINKTNIIYKVPV